MKINPVLLHHTCKKPKTPEGWIFVLQPSSRLPWEKQFDVFGKQRSEEEWDTGTEMIYGSQMQKGTYSPKGEAPEKVVLT